MALVDKKGLETEKLEDDKQVGRVADTVGYTLAGMDHQEAVDKGWKGDNNCLAFAGIAHLAS